MPNPIALVARIALLHFILFSVNQFRRPVGSPDAWRMPSIPGWGA
jgi:hypothetical protein